MNIGQKVFGLLIAAILFFMLITSVFGSVLSASDLADMPPYVDYTYTSYTNISNGAINLTAISKTLTASLAVNTNIAKVENLTVHVNSSDAVNTTYANVYYNGVKLGNITLVANVKNSTTWSIVCLSGVNTILINTTVQTSSAEYFTNATLRCATTLNGTDYGWLIAVVLVVMFIIFYKSISKKK